MPRGVRLYWIFFVFFGALVLAIAGAMQLTDGVFPTSFGPPMVLALLGVQMLAAGAGLRQMRKWGALLALLVPMAMVALDLLGDPASRQIDSMTAINRLGFTIIVALCILPSWNQMTWAPPAFTWLRKRGAGA